MQLGEGREAQHAFNSASERSISELIRNKEREAAGGEWSTSC